MVRQERRPSTTPERPRREVEHQARSFVRLTCPQGQRSAQATVTVSPVARTSSSASTPVIIGLFPTAPTGGSLGPSAIAAMSGSDVQRRLERGRKRTRALARGKRTVANRRARARYARDHQRRDVRRSSGEFTSIPVPRRPRRSRCSGACSGGRRRRLRGALGERRTSRSGYVPATAGGWRKTRPKTYLPLNDEAIVRHPGGPRVDRHLIHVVEDDICWFLCLRLLDGRAWQLDALALLETSCGACGATGLRGGKPLRRGRPRWIFFSAPVAAGSARRLGALLLREAMARCAELDLASYDRPSRTRTSCRRRGSGT